MERTIALWLHARSTPDGHPATWTAREAIQSPPMNRYPSWIHRIPELLEIVALIPDERIDRRRRVEELFDLRRSTAAHELLRRRSAAHCGVSLAISRSKIMARLRKALEHPDWRGERERRQRIRADIDSFEAAPRKSGPHHPAVLQNMEAIALPSLPATIGWAPGYYSYVSSAPWKGRAVNQEPPKAITPRGPATGPRALRVTAG
jgi:hypothetical protein